MSDDLPSQWVEAPLLQVVDSVATGVPEFKGSVEYFSTGSIQSDGSIAEGDYTFASRPSRANRWAKLDDVLQARMQFTDKPLLIEKRFENKLFSTGFLQLRANPILCKPRYLRHYVASPKFLKQRDELATGSTQVALTDNGAKGLTIPLAPPREQERIITKLDEVLGKLESSQKRLAKIPVLLKRFRQSVLAAACSGRLTADWRQEQPEQFDASELIAELELAHKNAGGHKKGNAAPPTDEAHDLTAEELPPTWELSDLRTAVCPDRPITYGILKPGPDIPDGVPYIRVADFPNDKLNLNTIRRTTRDIEKAFARARLRYGDILLSIRGTVGRVCVVPRELEGANITQDTARLSIQPALNSSFVIWFLRSSPTQKRMQKALKGVAVRGINIGDVRALQLPVPPLLEQNEIVRRVESFFALADQIEARFQKAQAQVDKLTPSILAKAFRGELVPQDPSDEPASVLLQKIKKEK